MSPVSASVAATGAPTFWPEPVFSATLRVIVPLGNTGALLETAGAIQTEITSPPDQLRLVPVQPYVLPADEVVAALRATWSALPMCNTQSEAAFPGALVKPSLVLVPRVERFLIV